MRHSHLALSRTWCGTFETRAVFVCLDADAEGLAMNVVVMYVIAKSMPVRT